MKILYAFQGTGNGHVVRAQEIVPVLKKYGCVDTLISGHQSQLNTDFPLDFQHAGISLMYNKHGGISYPKTFFKNNFFAAFKTIQEIDLNIYDLIINDYEPLTAWSCRLKNIKMLELSHQASMSFKETPKPASNDFIGKFTLKHYAPSKNKIGFHFDNYHPQIKKPVIRKKIRLLNPEKKGFYIVYLQSFSDENLVKVLKEIDVQWKVFSKYTSQKTKLGNVEIFPIDEVEFLKNFENCEGILCNAGFEGPAEALFLNKKLFVIPIHHQFEQECNAFALHQLGIKTSKILDSTEIKKWVETDENFEVYYPDDMEEIIRNEVLPF